MKVTVYNCKYALTQGIFEVEVDTDHIEKISKRTAYWNHDARCFFYFGRDCAYTLEEAKALAKTAQERKIKSIEKQLERVRAVDFT